MKHKKNKKCKECGKRLFGDDKKIELCPMCYKDKVFNTLMFIKQQQEVN